MSAPAAVAKVPSREIAPAETSAIAITPMQMLQMAVERGAELPQLEKLMDLQERWEAREAKKAFVTALNAFKADPPNVLKNKKAGFDGRGGSRTEYEYATLAQVVGMIAPALSKHGLSHTWKTDVSEGGIIVTCTLTHEMGHSETVTLRAPSDTSGAKNSIQAIGSTITYLERYTLLAITGLAAAGQDDDAGGIVTLINDAQKAELISLMREVNADTGKFLAYLGVRALDNLAESKFKSAKEALAAKRKKTEGVKS